ncbi:NAD-dependent epimerase/dehydratase family protein [soil metagenome]
MRILVTGGAGFIGSHIVDALVERGDDVAVLDCLHPLAHPSKPDYLNPGAEYLIADIRDRAAVDGAVRGVDAVCHQAAMVGLGVDFADVGDYVSINDAGTATLLKALWDRGFTGPVVLAGSMVVYGEGRYRCPVDGIVTPAPRRTGDLAAGRFDPFCPRCRGALAPQAIPEDARICPRGIYAATKLHQEHLCQVFARESGARCVCLRYHNVYGPRMPFDTPYAGVASIFRSSLQQGRPPQVFEDGHQIRDFVHSADVVRANLLAIDNDEAGGAYNIASGRPKTLLEMASCLCRGSRSGLEPQITGRFRSSDVRHVFASPARAARELGFIARIPFDEGMTGFLSASLRGSYPV